MIPWNKLIDFLAHGLLVLPLVFGFGLHSFDAYALTLAFMLLLLIGVTFGAPAVPAPAEKEKGEHDD
ncbi:hypothetical protein [Pseudothauera rhizosphaerae]|uniref:Uncharacterized protein n=1 Tax=Pseudothauera rhizosphaerae TaxID=2565932 RepID=A0A4S4AWI9_9RHOO|nr:hypothetical protein [Pseudothauera rhizosphaerae]THF64399.1 hypothetical protein E6O51_03575 [Pseudothauera rhizosphaerae]